MGCLPCELFNEPLEAITWPSSLESLTFGDGFDQDIEQINFPSNQELQLACIMFLKARVEAESLRILDDFDS